ncbi:iron ABC transporter permease [Kaustia mangrovi]|uniref:Iron ABC transporter permease n=1 Tax=Kaustia mangrovi TaxID=2593653 RepID=A0A7S8C669_9HYPH|nr:iron ABC transporter permease [Kaustia mangrovi]QPC44124.1 iron ABC transporter permease [Kaustia mangrovi]
MSLAAPTVRQSARPRMPLLAGLGLAAAAMFVLSLAIGYAPFDLGAAIGDALAGQRSLAALILLELRLPRALLGLLVGFTLGLAGAVMQGFLRNPLAEPGIIGVSGAAALGAVLVFYTGLAAVSSLLLPLGGIAAALCAGLVLFMLAGRGTTTTTLILAGVAMNSLAGALISLVLNLSPNPYAATEIMFWLMGSLADRSLVHVWIVLPLMAAGWAMMLWTARVLDALTLGEQTAQSLGFDLRITRVVIVSGIALSVGSAVAVSGAIGFVGLVVPHLLRPFTGHRPAALLVASGLGGAVLTLAADVAVRLVAAQPELKLGVVTALIGAPFLFSLIWRLRGQMR